MGCFFEIPPPIPPPKWPCKKILLKFHLPHEKWDGVSKPPFIETHAKIEISELMEGEGLELKKSF